MKLKDKYHVQPIDNHVTKEWMLKKHYARRVTPVTYAFGLMEAGKLVGILTFGFAIPEGLYMICGEKYKDRVCEFNRLCIDLPLKERKNVASWFCAQAIKKLPKPLVLVSFSDQNQGHIGYVYQSLNWHYCGEGGGGGEMILKDGRKVHTRSHSAQYYRQIGMVEGSTETKPKYRYVYFHGDKRQVRDMRKRLKYEIQPYPKGESKRYDDTAEVDQKNVGLGLVDWDERK